MRTLPLVLVLLASSIAHAQTFTPGQSLNATCVGRWSLETSSATAIVAECTEPPPPSFVSIVVDSSSLGAFHRVPVDAVRRLRVMSVDRSVGWNIAQGLERCLAVETSRAPSMCTRWSWLDGQYAVPPMTWTAHPLSNWRYWAWPGLGNQMVPELACADRSSYLACFESWVNANASQWNVVSMQPSYLDAGSGIGASEYLAMYERLRARHPGLTIILHTASLARVIGTAANHAFNTAVRGHVARHGGVLIDIADIETVDPLGGRTFYNGFPAISPYYTSESNGGHLGYPSAGMIRLAQAWWIALGQITGWRP